MLANGHHLDDWTFKVRRNLIKLLTLALLVTVFSPVTIDAQALPPSCSSGGTCAVGDIGPGGGIVFYVAPVGTHFQCGPNHADDCSYLEAAPKSWSGSTPDAAFYWNLNSYEVNGINRDPSPNMAGDQLGLGLKNSTLMAAADSSSGNAGVAARGYTGQSKNDWYLPTIAELGVLCQYAHGQTPTVGASCDYAQNLNTGVPASYQFLASSYQSSSASYNQGEVSRGNAQWHQNFVSGADGNSAQQSTWGYAAGQFSTRPIRAFGITITVANQDVACGGGGSFRILNSGVISSSPYFFGDTTPACSGSVSIPYGVTSIGNAAFWQKSITSFSMPNTLRTIGDSALRQTGLTTVSIPASVESIGFLAFGTTFLTSLNFASDSNLTTIGPDAFQSSQFTSVTIPTSVTSIGSTAFLGNTSLTEINFGGNRSAALPANWPWSAPASVNVNAKLPCSTTGYFVIQSSSVIGRHDCIGSVDIPEGVTSIGGEAFDAHGDWGGVGRNGGGNYGSSSIPTNITSLTIPNTVTSIGQFAFRSLGATTVTIPNSVTSIGDFAFNDASHLTSLTIGDGITTIPSWTFAGMTNLQSLTIPTSVTTIGTGAFWGLENLTSLTIPDNVTTIDPVAFKGMHHLTSLTLSNNLTTISSEAFSEMTMLPSLTIPSSVTAIGNKAFYSPVALTSLVIPDSVITIGDEAFEYDRSLANLTIGTGVTSIGANAFFGELSLNSIVIPDNVTSIGQYVFAMDAPNLSTTTLTIGRGLSSIPLGAFAGLNAITELAIPNNITTVSDWALAYLTALTTITISSSVTSLGSNTFNNTSAVTRLNYCGNLTSQDFSDAGISYLDSHRTCGISAPGVPSAISAAVTGIGSVAVSFTAPPSNGGATIASYTATATPGGATKSIYQSGNGTINFTGLSAGTTYTFKVTASNWGKTSSQSTASNAVTTPNVPGAPTGVTAALTGGTTTNISYTAPVSDGGLQITSYTATADHGGISATVTQSGSGVITVTGLNPGETYSFTVTATNPVGSSSPSNSTSSISVPNHPDPPASATAQLIDPTTAEITFMAPLNNGGDPITSYTATAILAGTSGTVSQSGSGVITVSNLTPGGLYSFSVVATNASGDSDPITTNYVGGGYDGLNGQLPCGTKGYFVVTNNAVVDNYLCSGSVDIPSGVTSIGAEALAYRNALTSLSLPETLITIETYAFYGDSALVTLSIPNSVTTIGRSAFGELHSLTSLTIGSGITTIDRGVFENASSLASLTIPDTIISIQDNAFGGAYSLTNLHLGTGLTSIGPFAFYDAQSLTTLTIPNNVTTMGDGAFLAEGQSNLSTLNIGSGITTISSLAFYGASALTTLRIPENVTAIGDQAFDGASSLSTLLIRGTLTNLGQGAFNGTNSQSGLTFYYCGTDRDARYQNGGFDYAGMNGVTPLSCDSLTPVITSPTSGTAFTAPVGAAFSQTLTYTTNSPPGVISLAGGVLPQGITLNTATGEISGTPTTPGNFRFVIEVTDTLGESSTAVITIVVPPLSLYAPDLLAWKLQSDIDSDFNSITSSADGRYLAATTTNVGLFTSDDFGVTWNLVPSTNNGYWDSVASSADGSRLSAVRAITGVNYGIANIWTSSDYGKSWMKNQQFEDYEVALGINDCVSGVYSVAMNSEGSYISTFCNQGVFTSHDYGLTWSFMSTRGDEGGLITYSSSGEYLAISRAGYVYILHDGDTSFTDITPSGINAPQSIAFSRDGTKLFVGAADGKIWVSSDYGVSWTSSAPFTNAGNPGVLAITSNGDGSQLSAIVTSGSALKYLYSSFDGGVTWAQTLDPTFGSDTPRLASSSDGLRLAVTTRGKGIWVGPATGNNASLASVTIKNVLPSNLGTPSRSISSLVAGAIGVSFTAPTDTTTSSSFIPSAASSSIKIVKYSAGQSFASFATDTAYNDEAISEGDFFIIKVTAADSTALYYRINASVDPGNNGSFKIAYTGLDTPVGGRRVIYAVITIEAPDCGCSFNQSFQMSSDSGDFSILNDGCTSEYVAGDTCYMRILFEPARAGQQTARIDADFSHTFNSPTPLYLTIKATGLPASTAPAPYIWNSHNVLADQKWQGIASSADGRKLAAISSGGDVFVSSNAGATWRNSTETSTASGGLPWVSIASSADGSKIAAATYANGIYLSTDSGITWTISPSSTFFGISHIASSSDGQTLMISATGDTDDEQLYRSIDGGQTWSPISAAGWREWSSIAFSDNGNVIVASVGPYYVPAVDNYYSFTNSLYVSTDGGDTWVRNDAVGQGFWMAVTSDKSGTHLAAVARDGDIWTSSNSGSTWVDRDTAGTRNWSDIASSDDGSHLIATTDTGYIYTSADFGANWTVASTPGVHSWRSAAISSNGNYAAAVGKNLDIWTAVPAPVPTPVQSANVAAPKSSQKSAIKSFSPATFGEMDATLISIAGSFPEKITEITINGVAAKLDSWSQSASLVTLNFPASAVGGYSIKLINGSTPDLQEFNVNVVAKKLPTPSVVVAPQANKPDSNNAGNIPSIKPLKKIVTERIFFDLGSALVRGENLTKIQALSRIIAGLGNKITINVTGYAQPTPGSEATDGALSKNRAKAVARILRSLGVNTSVTYLGAGRAAVNAPSSRYVEITAANK